MIITNYTKIVKIKNVILKINKIKLPQVAVYFIKKIIYSTTPSRSTELPERFNFAFSFSSDIVGNGVPSELKTPIKSTEVGDGGWAKQILKVSFVNDINDRSHDVRLVFLDSFQKRLQPSCLSTK